MRLPQWRSTPAQCDADVAGHAIWPVGNLVFQAVPARFEMYLPELIDLLRQTRERIRPAGLLLIDGAPLVGAQIVGKTADLDLGQSVGHCSIDNGGCSLCALCVADARGLG